MRVAMYLRLSSEDGDLKDTGKAESESISNQRGLLQNFISSRPEFRGWEISEFCDDGWSGKNFERPDFLRMMEQVKQGQIHCIVVKDLSRFGRDYLVVGNYISRVFPFLGVRFIAVNDGFDSSRPQDIDSLDTSFKTLIYDLYSRELSGKVKNAKRMRAEKGLFLSPFAPYGYVKAPEDKNRLIIDDEAADIVRKIFTLTADGVKPVEIAAMFNREGVPTPMLYKRAAGCSRDRWPSIHEENFWTTGVICKVLRDERYIGKCVYIYTPAVIKKVSGFERPYIILQNDQGQNIKFFYNKSLSAELGNTVTIFAPYSSVFQESENVFVICSYFYSYISDYSNLNSN